MSRTPVADWQQLSALYELADALDPATLDAWLAQLRTQGHPLLLQLEQMLGARSQVQRNGFLGALPRLAVAAEPLVTDWAGGSRIGPYRLVRHLGAGGMAEVWLAQRDDGAFQRKVAMKLMFRHAGSSRRDSVAQRFARERDILASLHHPHIAGLHDAGVTTGGQPWLALEYVEGEPLAAWCDARQLDIAARVRLFRQVLLAVQHAHANLVIHRDLKPGNILVTVQGEVRLLDFGIAKLMEPEGGALADTELTRQAGRPMTPRYAAPEQLLGQPLTTSCDVYALGVVLYELLCGERPYELKVDSAAQLEQAILDLEPRAPSRRTLSEATAKMRGSTGAHLRKTLASDLDAIVLHALAKQPAQRYPSVEALRADLDRWLEGEPVDARAPSAAYRLSKFAGRHRIGVALGAVAVLALVGAAAVAVLMGLQAREESARAVAARDFMLNIFQRADQEKSRGADITARDMLETGRKDVLTRLAGQPKLQAELLRGIAKIQSDMGEYVTADSTFAELVRIHAQLHESREEAMSRADHAFNALQMNNLALAERLLKGAESVPGRPLDDPELNARLTEVAGRIALNHGEAGRAGKLLSAGRRAASQTLGADHVRTFKLGRALFRAERDRGNFEAALALQDELRRVAGRVAGLGRVELAVMDWEHVNLLAEAGRFAQALDLVDVVLPKCIDALGAQEQTCRFLFLNRGQTLLRLGRVPQALQTIPQLHAMTQDATLPSLQIEALLLEFRLRSMTGGAQELGPLFERVREFGQSGSDVAIQSTFKAAALVALAEARLRAGDAVEARRWADLSLALLGDGARSGAALQIAGIGRMLVGMALRQQGHPEQALIWLGRATADFTTARGAQHPVTQLFGLNTALALADLQRLPDAVAIARRAEPVLRASLGADAPTYLDAVALLNRLERMSAGDSPVDAVAAVSQWGRASAPSKRGFFR